MAASWKDLITIPTKDEVLEKAIALLRLADFPVASWHAGSVLRDSVETQASLHSDLATSIQQIAKGGFIKYAAEVDDGWVDLCAENVFAERRKEAVYTRGEVRITDGGRIGPLTITPGSFWIANADKSLRYVNVTGGAVPLGGTLSLTFQAETAGARWNVGNGSLTEILTPQPGLTVANPGMTSGTWITQQGADKETNARLVERCLDKWATLGSGSNEGAYRYHATSASPEITRAKIFSPGGGSVRVVIAGDAGPVSTTALGLAAALIAAKRPIGVPDVRTVNAIVNAQSVEGILFVRPGVDPTSTLSAAQGAVDALQRATAIGSKVSREQIIRALLVPAVEDLTLTSPRDDFQLGSEEVWVPTYSLLTATAV